MEKLKPPWVPTKKLVNVVRARKALAKAPLVQKQLGKLVKK